jgi:ATP-dependent Clp protease ATP-binding subunit ClpC
MFSPLTLDQMYLIVDLQMKEIQGRLNEHGLDVCLTESARNWLANVGFDPSFGARPLRRALQKHVESPLSVKLLSGEYKPGDTVLVDYKAHTDQLVFSKTNVIAPAPVQV